MRIAIIGMGNMGAALGRGLSPAAKKDDIELIFLERSHEKSKNLGHLNGMFIQSVDDLPRNLDALVLCVKPQDLRSISDLLKDQSQKPTVISILAGVPLTLLESTLGYHGPIVRSMPNIAATVMESATVLCANSHVNEKDKENASYIFSSVGEISWSDESLLDAVTGLSGSGPAYIYMVIEALTDGGVKMGIPRPLASMLATQTVIGAGKLVKKTGEHPAVLRDKVTTPGGTTISAIHELETHGLRSMLISAVVTATQKSEELQKKV